MREWWPWITLALLGAYHGINPGMGWLFAVSLGLQERSRAAVLRAFAPIAIGHFISIAAVVAVVVALQQSLRPEILRWTGAGALIAFGIYKLVAPMSHPKWVGMRVGPRQLAMWSFLMATAHGAGLMVAPVVLKMNARPAPAGAAKANAGPLIQASLKETKASNCDACASASTPRGDAKGAPSGAPSKPEAIPSCHAQISRMASNSGSGMAAAMAGVCLHTLAMFLAMAGIALIVYNKIGLAILRTAWFNLDLVWAAALIGAGILTLIL